MHSPSNGKLYSRRVLTTVHSRVKTHCIPVTAGIALFVLANWLWFGSFSKSNCEDSSNEIQQLQSYSSNSNDNYDDVLDNPGVAMDDPRLIEAIRKKLLIPPSLKTYKFASKTLMNPEANPSGGQVQAVQDILRGFGGNGFFIECGANDGEWHSNTIWLERTMGWKGLLIEADPTVFPKLASKNRNAWSGHFCLSNFPYPKTLPFYVDTKKHSLGSGLIKSKQYFAEHQVNVQCLPLYSVLLAVNRTTVDFFSLDVEGSELDILNTLDFDKVIFKIITIEHVVLKEGKTGLRNFMESKGYIFFRTVVDRKFAAGDSIFIHKSVKLTEEQIQRIGEEDSPALRPPRT